MSYYLTLTYKPEKWPNKKNQYNSNTRPTPQKTGQLCAM